MSAPRVSIVLPSFNGSRHLDEAVASVVAQTFKDWELVLVDDGSSDDTGARMEAWAQRDPRIRALRLSPNRGLPAALNEGFRHARGELFTWTSDDNLYLPGALERMAEHLERSDDVDLVYADYLLFSDAGGERRLHVFSPRLLALRGTVGCCFLYRREVHEELRGFDEQLFLAEDYDFWLRASTRFRFEAIHELLYRYRVHDASLTSQRTLAAVRAAVRAMERHLPALPRRERAHARLQRARDFFRRGHLRDGRALVLQALREWPGAALRSEHWRPLATCLLGTRAVRRLLLLLGRIQPRVILILLPGRPGGVTTDCLDLTAARPPGAAPVELCWLDDDHPDRALARDAAAPGAKREVRVRHRWPRENLFAVLRRMRRALGGGPGVIVANEFFGLAYAACYGRQNPLVQIVHQDAPTYYRLAEAFEPFVDMFITVSAHIRDELCRRLPERAGDVRYLRSGVPARGPRRVAREGSLRLVFSGRLDPVNGVLDLPLIDRLAREGGTRVRWTIVGTGPLEAELRAAFAPEAEVVFAGALPCEEARARLAAHDALVLPSHVEGLSPALLEAMAAGIVPVVSDLASGAREVVEDGVTGFLARPGRPEEFAQAILRLDRDRALLERVSAAAADRVAARHALERAGADFHAMLDDVARRPVPHRPVYRRGPSRLDRRWLPNALVRAIRALRSPKTGAR